MRVTTAMVNHNVQRNLSKRYGEMFNLQEQLATGKRLRKPSDDPIDVSNALKLRTKQTQNSQYKRNIEDGLAIMGIASSAMNSMNEMLHRMRELAVQAANDTNATADRQYIQQEVDQLSRQMLSVINTQFKGDYIFNGTQSKIPPYEIKASKAELTNYLQSTMATYGAGSNGVSYIKSYEIDNSRNDYVYLDYQNQPALEVGDKIQMKWHIDGSTEPAPDAVNFLPDSLDLGNGNRLMDTIDIGGDTFRRYNGIDDPDDPNYISDPDYAIDYRTGEITVLSTKFRDALHNEFGSPTPVVAIPSANDAALLSPPVGINFKYSTTNTVQIIGGNTGAPIENLFPGSLKIKIGGKEYLEGFGEYNPGYYDKDGVFQKGDDYNVYDYSVDYQTGKITIYNLELLNDMRAPVPIDGQFKYDYRVNPKSQYYDPRMDAASGYIDPNGYAWTPADYNNYIANHNESTQYRHGQFELTFEYLERGVNIYGDKVASHGEIYRAIEEGIKININIGVDELLRDKWTGNEMIGVMFRYSEALHTDDRDGIQTAITELTTMYDAVLNSQSQMGARIYRLELTQTRNEEQSVEVGMQLTSLEDADLADVISKMMLAQNVYNAALQAAMRVIQPSLANFM